MTLVELARLVAAMRRAQGAYLKTWDAIIWRAAWALERDVDWTIQEILDQAEEPPHQSGDTP